jgi:hypothetical protein
MRRHTSRPRSVLGAGLPAALLAAPDDGKPAHGPVRDDRGPGGGVGGGPPLPWGGYRPHRGSKWDPNAHLHAASVAAVHPDESASRGPEDCRPCLIIPSSTWSYHTICRVYEVLYARRACWTNLRYLTSLTFDITSDRYWFVQQCVSYLRRGFDLDIATRSSGSPGNCRYQLRVDPANPGHPTPRRIWRVRRGDPPGLGKPLGGEDHHDAVEVPPVHPR